MTPATPRPWQSWDGAPDPGTVLCKLDDIEDGGTKPLSFGSGTKLFDMFILRQGETARAYVNSCPHVGSPLDFPPNKFFNAERTHLRCATHDAQFEIEDGLCVAGPCKGQALSKIPIAIEDGMIVLQD